MLQLVATDTDVLSLAERALQAQAAELEALHAYSGTIDSDYKPVLAICDRTTEAIDRLAQTASLTLMTVAAKARVALARDYDVSESLIKSILIDIVRLAGNHAA